MGDRGFEVSRGSGRYRGDDQGVTPVVGIILLLGMVFVGAAVVASSGVIMIDALETESETERALDCLDRTDHSVETLLRANKPESIPCDSTFTDDGTVTIRLLDENDNELKEFKIDKLGAFEYDLDSRTVGYQGGGIFQLRDGSATVHRAPNVGFGFDPHRSLENQTLDLGFHNMTESRSHGALTRMHHDQQRSTTETEKLADALEEESYSDIEITVESRYHEAWASHFRESFYADAYADVDVATDSTAGTTTVTIQNAKPQQPHFEISNVSPADWVVPYGPGEAFSTDVTVTNTGTAAGLETIVLEVPDADDETKTVSTGTLDQGESVTKQVSFETERIPSGSPSPETLDVDAYDRYDYTVSTSDGSAAGSFYLGFPDEALYRIESFTQSVDEPILTVTADVRNIGAVESPVETTLTLESDSSSLPQPLETYDRTLSAEPWNESTLEYEINKSVLPDANYTYTLEVHNDGDAATVCSNYPDACTRDGEFRIEDGAVGDPGAVIVTEPTQVKVSIIGTEISNERYVSGGYDKYWDPVTASAVVGDERYRFKPDGTVEQIPLDQPHYTPSGKSMDDYDLNTWDSQTKVYEFETNMTSGSVTIEATRWQCQSQHFNYNLIVERQYDGTYHYDCPSYYYGEPTTVDTNDGVATSDSGFVMTRDYERNYIPDIPPFYDRQRSVQEIFDDGTDDIELEDNHLELGQNDFAFMMEATMDRDRLINEYRYEYDGPYDLYTNNQTELNLAAWDIAKNYRDADATMDPNYNDVIGVVQIDGGGQYVDLDGILDSFQIDQSGIDPSLVKGSEEYDPPGPTIQSGPGVIEIS